MVWDFNFVVFYVGVFVAGFGFGRFSARRGSIAPARRAATSPPPVSDPAIDAAIRAGRKVEAIKLYRQRDGAGLKPAKLAIEQRARQLGKPL